MTNSRKRSKNRNKIRLSKKKNIKLKTKKKRRRRREKRGLKGRPCATRWKASDCSMKRPKPRR